MEPSFAAEANALLRWLLQDAYPFWWTRGADLVHGGFHESLRHDGAPTGAPRRARVYPRQIYAFSIAKQLGWSGPAEAAIRHGLKYLRLHYRRADGMYRALAGADGTPMTEDAVLYDHAFVLLAVASAHDSLGESAACDSARELLANIHSTFQHPSGGFEEGSPRKLPLLSNSHMHLLEACLEWLGRDRDPRWHETGQRLVDLVLQRFRDPASGFVREYFNHDWTPMPGADGRIVEPGHQYEWAWLLLRWSQHSQQPGAFDAALELIELAERHGVDAERGIAIDELFTDGAVRNPRARLWPQTERIKAACLAAVLTGNPRYSRIAQQGARSLMKYFATPLAGLWHDKMSEDGAFVAEHSPASSLYHIASAILELQRALAAENSST